MRVLVIRAGALGDTIFATSIIEPLRARFGADIRIDWLARPGIARLFAEDERIQHVFSLRHAKIPLLLNPDKQKIVLHSLQHKYDYIFNLELGRQFFDVVRFVRARHKVGAPFARYPERDGEHAVESMRHAYEDIVGSEHMALAYPSLVGGSTDAVRRKFKIDGSYLVLSPTNSHVAKRSGKNFRAWPQEYWAQLLPLLAKTYPGQILMVGNKGEEAAVAGLSMDGEKIINLVGQTSLPELVGLVAGAEMMISTDTGPSHIAAASATPVLVLSGPTDYRRTGPLAGDACQVHIFSANLPCSPCYENGKVDDCEYNQCMHLLTPEKVVAAAAKMLAGRN